MSDQLQQEYRALVEYGDAGAVWLWVHMLIGKYADLQATCQALEAERDQVKKAASAVVHTAESIARQAHEGQKCTVTGEPYIRHVERVVAHVVGDDAKAVAWLHDVIEDSDWMPSDFDEYGVPAHITDAVLLLSRNKAIPYEDYISNLIASGNNLAITVKRADLLDHLRPNCPERLRPRYEAALRRLTDTSSLSALQAVLAEIAEKWQRLCGEQLRMSEDSDAKRDGANSHTERARARIYRECRDDLLAGLRGIRQTEDRTAEQTEQE